MVSSYVDLIQVVLVNKTISRFGLFLILQATIKPTISGVRNDCKVYQYVWPGLSELDFIFLDYIELMCYM